MKKYVGRAEEGLTFGEILLDERVLEGNLFIPRNLLIEAGGMNTELKAKRAYELLLRVAQNGKLLLKDEADPLEEYEPILDHPYSNQRDGLQTDCYILSRYSTFFKENELFDTAIMGILAEAEALGDREEVISFLESMLIKKEEYLKRSDCTEAILLLKGDEICHGVLNEFAENMMQGIHKRGYKTEVFDAGKEDWMNIARYGGRRFKAVIGFQTYLFSAKLADGIHYFADKIQAPKFNLLLDHPIWFRNHLEYRSGSFTMLTHDTTYKAFMEEYYHQKVELLPPGGYEVVEHFEKIYDITFVGNYGNYRNILAEIAALPPFEAKLGSLLFEMLKRNSKWTFEKGFYEVLKDEGLSMTKTEAFEALYTLKKIILALSYYSREMLMETLLEQGLNVTIFGESFREASFANHKNLTIMPSVSAEKTYEIYKKSKISLNPMTWHKAGFTERMANIMLAETLLVTEETEGLTGGEGEEYLSYQLDTIPSLPSRIRQVLSCPETLRKMAKKGRERALREFTWEKRAEQFLALISSQKQRDLSNTDGFKH